MLCTHTKPLRVLAEQAYTVCQWRYNQDLQYPTRIPAYVITFDVALKKKSQLRIQLLTELIGKLGLASHSCSNAGNTCACYYLEKYMFSHRNGQNWWSLM